MNQFRDKINLTEKLTSGQPIILELGAGTRRRPGRIHIDAIDLPETDIVTDLENGFPFLPDNSVDEIHATSFLEHIRNLEFLMSEIYRVLKPGGRLYAFTPHFSNHLFYSDYTHTRPFGLYSYSYFSKSHHPFHRKVPKFYNSCNFRISKIKLIFRSRLLTWFFNLRFRLMELYESHLTFILPCYGLDVELTTLKND